MTTHRYAPLALAGPRQRRWYATPPWVRGCQYTTEAGIPQDVTIALNALPRSDASVSGAVPDAAGENRIVADT